MSLLITVTMKFFSTAMLVVVALVVGGNAANIKVASGNVANVKVVDGNADNVKVSCQDLGAPRVSQCIPGNSECPPDWRSVPYGTGCPNPGDKCCI